MWIAAALASEGFEVVRDTDGCRISMRPEAHPDGAAMRADCAWPDVDPAALIGLLAEYEHYDRLVAPIVEVHVRRIEPERTLVYQRQSVFGIADREVLLWMSREVPAEGGARFVWTAATEEPLALSSGSVRTPKNTGFWEVVPEGAGSRVVHEIALDAGGSVPRWIVELVRTRAFARIMSDVHELAATP